MTYSGKMAKPRGSLFLIIVFLSNDLRVQGTPEWRSRIEGAPTPHFEVELDSEKQSDSPKGSPHGA